MSLQDIDPQALLVGVGTAVLAVATIALVLTTIYYARGTDRIARATAAAAQSAQETAALSLMQNVLLVQPRFVPTKPLLVRFLPATLVASNLPNLRCPISLETEMRNFGSGAAMNVNVRVVVLGYEFSSMERIRNGASVPPGSSIELAHSLDTAQYLNMANTVSTSEAPAVGIVELRCEDAMGNALTTRWEVGFDQHVAPVLAERRVTYEGGGDDFPYAGLLGRWRHGIASASAPEDGE